MHLYLKRILIFLGIFLVGLAILNHQYLIAQFNWIFNKPEIPSQVIVEPDTKVESNTIHIPSLGTIAPIVESTANNEIAFQEALQKGVVHYPGTAQLGEVGNAYIFGHSSDTAFAKGDYKTVFALLPRIQKDAEVLVSDAEGKQFKYKVYDQFVANSDDVHLLDQNTDGRKILTLQTSYPIGTALKRYIVKAELVE